MSNAARSTSWAKAAAIAAGSLALLGAAAFAAQAIVLPRPTRHELVTGAIMQHLLTVRSVRGREWLSGREQRDACGPATGGDRSAEQLVLGRRRLVSSASVFARAHVSPRRLTWFMAAGCPLAVTEMLGNWLDRRTVHLAATRVGGAAAYAVRVGRPSRHLTIFVSRRSLTPLRLRFTAGGTTGSGVVEAVTGRDARGAPGGRERRHR
jgi:hypothetical protein